MTGQEALKKLEMLSDCAEAMKELPKSNWIEYADNEAELDYQLWRAYEDLKQALLKAEKEHNVLEFIKKNMLDIESFNTTFVENAYNYNFYEISYGTYGKGKLTEEEFNLLKEVLE